MPYVVTGYVKRLGRRDVLTVPSSKSIALKRKKKIEEDLEKSIPKYKMFSKLKVMEI